MKVALCNVQEFNSTIGGIERVSVSLAESLIRQGIKVIFIVCRKSVYSEPYDLPARQYFLPHDTDYHTENVAEFTRIVKDENIDILINQNSHSESYNHTCREVKENTGVKMISVLHFSPDMRIKGNRNLVNFTYLSWKENIVNILKDICTRFPLQYITMRDQCRMFRSLYRYSDRVVLLSNEFKPAFIKYSGIKDTNHLVAINNMLSFQYDPELPPKKKQILWCGRLLFSQKRPDRILQIWKKIQDKLPDWNLVVVGDGPFGGQMHQLSKKLGLKRIEFTGFRDPVSYYKESSISCVTSNHEGWPLVLVEALQCGCVPVAFASYDSIREIIHDGENGFLVKPFDMDCFAERILQLASGGTERYARNAIKSMARFVPEEIAKQWINLFNDVLAN